jgi:hypothetical protein
MLDMRKIRKRMRTPNLLDCRNIYDPEEMEKLAFRYGGVGRGVHLKTAAERSARARKPTGRARSKASRGRSGGQA